MKRNYPNQTDRERPFTPPETKSLSSWLVTAVGLVLLAFITFKVIGLWNERATIKAKQGVEGTVTGGDNAAQPTEIVSPTPQGQSRAQTQDAVLAPGAITKCTVQGKVSYGDGVCPAGATAQTVVVKKDENLMTAVRAPIDAQPVLLAPPISVIAQTNNVEAKAAVRAECEALDVQIKSLDSMARQPQSAQTQDWIRGERAKARSQQFARRC